MDHLFRDLAPVSAAGWAKIQSDATQTLKTILAGRKLVDFKGPQGWQASSVGTGRSDVIASPPASGVHVRLRHVLPLVELRVPFEMRRGELDALDRGAKDLDTDSVIAAARKIAIAEDRAIFHGYPAAGIRGICDVQSEPALSLGDDLANYPVLIAVALNRLRDRGVNGPYAVALSERCYTDLTDATKAGYPVLEHVQRLLDGPLVWAPGLDGAVVLSLRGGDFELTVGQDFSIGYSGHDTDLVRLYIEESFTFWNISPQAAVLFAARAAAEADQHRA
jgi:uncharacterized linocin/CFP29 family protein